LKDGSNIAVSAQSSPKEVRMAARTGRLSSSTRGLAKGFVQAGVVALPKGLANDFLVFCQKNPGPCPLIEVTETGKTSKCAADGDLRTDVPGYNLYKDGELVDQGHDIGMSYGKDLVWFAIGCSYSFEYLLDEAGIALKGLKEGHGNPLFVTKIMCERAGAFYGPLVVSMRPVPQDKVGLASCLSGKLPIGHRAPIHVGDPSLLGITDTSKPDYGTAVKIGDDEIPMFWACSVTPQAIAKERRIPLMITQRPGQMFLTDYKVLSMLL